jgi:hypothetical protein
MLLGGIFEIGTKLIDKLFTSDAEKKAAQLELLKLEQAGELEELKTQMSAILAEASSADPWTSRARPSFMYVMYLLFLTAIPMGIVHAFAPVQAAQIATGFGAWLNAIPSEMYWLFGAGYLGYTTARTWEKKAGK